jgi:hypothetical protein
MYRVFLIPTVESPKTELWLEAHDVHESVGGAFWDFVDRENRVIRRLEKTRVKSFVVTPDRRKPRPLEHSVMQDPRWGVRE